jgi:hypothetical protein
MQHFLVEPGTSHNQPAAIQTHMPNCCTSSTKYRQFMFVQPTGASAIENKWVHTTRLVIIGHCSPSLLCWPVWSLFVDFAKADICSCRLQQKQSTTIEPCLLHSSWHVSWLLLARGSKQWKIHLPQPSVAKSSPVLLLKQREVSPSWVG